MAGWRLSSLKPWARKSRIEGEEDWNVSVISQASNRYELCDGGYCCEIIGKQLQAGVSLKFAVNDPVLEPGVADTDRFRELFSEK